jgi:hypothetical protein
MARQRHLTHGKDLNARQRALPCGAGKTHGKESVAGQYMQRAHGKGFAVRFSPFAVPFARTAKHCSPVVKVASYAIDVTDHE